MAYSRREVQRAARIALGRRAALALDTGASASDVAKTLGVSRTQLYKALREAQAAPGESAAHAMLA